MKYQVTVRRKEHREHVFEVEADSREEAEDKALEASYDHGFNQNQVHYADEDVTFVSAPNTAITDPETTNHQNK
jgi:prephenate dehydrogenase